MCNSALINENEIQIRNKFLALKIIISLFDEDNVYIKEAFIDQRPTMKRFRPAAMGRAVRILKRTSHLTIIISDDKN